MRRWSEPHDRRFGAPTHGYEPIREGGDGGVRDELEAHHIGDTRDRSLFNMILCTAYHLQKHSRRQQTARSSRRGKARRPAARAAIALGVAMLHAVFEQRARGR
jgi:hypothetical protein